MAVPVLRLSPLCPSVATKHACEFPPFSAVRSMAACFARRLVSVPMKKSASVVRWMSAMMPAPDMGLASPPRMLPCTRRM